MSVVATVYRYQLTRRERLFLTSVGVIGGATLGFVLTVVALDVFKQWSSWSTILLGVVTGAVLALGLSKLILRRWRLLGGFSGNRAMGQALRTRTLPTDADPIRWSALLDYQEKGTFRVVLTVVFVVALAVLSLVLLLTGVGGDVDVWQWFVPIVLIGSAIYLPFEARSKQSRIQSLREQLAHHPTPQTDESTETAGS